MSTAQDKLKPNPFANDDGKTVPALAEALDLEEFAPRLEAIVNVLPDSRVLVPVLAHDHPGRTADGGVVDHASQDKDPCKAAAMLAVEAPDGRAAMPIFSSVEALMNWNPNARPVPVHTQNAAIAAVAEADSLLVLDAAPTGPWLSWQARGQCSRNRGAVDRTLAGRGVADNRCPRTCRHRGPQGHSKITPGRKAETAIVIAVDGEAPRELISAALNEASQRLGQIEELQHRVDSIELIPARTA